MRQALDANDADKIFDAQQAISKITIEQERHRLADEQRKQNVSRETSTTETQAQTQQQPQQPARPDRGQNNGQSVTNGLVITKS